MGEFVPTNHRQAERTIVKLVESGEWEIDTAGHVWRIAVRCGGGRLGGLRILPCARRRVEKRIPVKAKDGTFLGEYLMVRVMLDGKRYCGLAHRLVWMFFNGPIPDGMVINHINGVKDDNRPENLECVTYSENMKHAHRTGLVDQFGQKNPGSSLEDTKIALIRNAYASGAFTQQQLADKHGCSHQHVSRLVKGQQRGKQLGPVDGKDHRHIASERDSTTGRFVRALPEVSHG